MKKTLAIVLAVLMAVAALSSFAFVVGGGEAKADFELLRIFAADIDVTQAGVRAYEKVEESKDYWTPGKSLCVAVEFRVWNRTLDGHAGAPVGKNYAIAVTSTTADLSFVQYAVTKVASYVEINGVKQLSRVATMPLGTVTYNSKLNAGLFNVVIVPQIPAGTALANVLALEAKGQTAINVYNTSLLGVASVKGYVATPVWAWNAAGTDLESPAVYALNSIGVPVLNYSPLPSGDPQYVDYTLFLSAKHLAPNAQGLGDLSASFTTSWGDSWVSLLNADLTENTANINKLEALLGLTKDSLDITDATLEPATLVAFYGGAPAETSYGFTQFLNLSELGFVVLRSDYDVTLDGDNIRGFAEDTDRAVIRYDVFRYDPTTGGSKRYVASYVTENLLISAGASAIMLEYNGGEVGLNMWGNYIMASAITGVVSTALGVTPAVGGLFPILAAAWTNGSALDTVPGAELTEISDLNKMHTEFATGIGQAQGWPILNDQFTANLAAPKFEGKIDNTYLAGTTVAVEVAPVDEGTGAPADEVDGEIVEGDEIDVPTAGDATIAFVCAAAAILACAALAFVMKKAR